MNNLKNEALFSRQEAAQFLGGVCLTTLGRLNIPKLKIRRRTFYRREDIDKWILNQTVHGEVQK